MLVPFVVRNGRLFLLLTQRARHLKHHPGQISFPGGRFEPEDGNLLTTAYRETFEETGIEQHRISVIGKLGQYQTISNYMVTPFVGFVQPNYQLNIDHNEVDDVFEVPWSFFLRRVNHHQLEVKRRGFHYNIHFMPYKERFIWGTTALMIHDLVKQFE